MKKLAAILMLATALVAPAAAQAASVNISAQMTRYSGPEAYLAVYLTNLDGSYNSTLWVAGHKTRYYGSLRGWARAAAQDATLSLDGITGASAGSGSTMNISVNIADALIDAGYTIHVDSAVEHGGEYSDDAVIALTSNAASVTGSGYIWSLSVSM